MDDLHGRIVAALPRRMPGRMVSVIAVELGEPTHVVQEALLAMERRGQVLCGSREGSQRWYQGPAALGSIDRTMPAEPEGLW